MGGACLRCHSGEFVQKDNLCLDCEKQLGKMWVKIYKDVRIEERKKNIKIKFLRNDNGYSKQTTYGDGFIANQVIQKEEFMQGIKDQITIIQSERAVKLMDKMIVFTHSLMFKASF